MTRKQFLAWPVKRRNGLSRVEAAALLGVSQYTIGNYWRAGLLPSTTVDGGGHLYLRAELEALRNAPRYNGHGVDYAAARAHLAY